MVSNSSDSLITRMVVTAYLLMLRLFCLEPKRPCMKMIGLHFDSAAFADGLSGQACCANWSCKLARDVENARLLRKRPRKDGRKLLGNNICPIVTAIVVDRYVLIHAARLTDIWGKELGSMEWRIWAVRFGVTVIPYPEHQPWNWRSFGQDNLRVFVVKSICYNEKHFFSLHIGFPTISEERLIVAPIQW